MARQRRQFSVAFKRQLALEYLSGRASQGALSRRHDISPNLIANWIKAFKDGKLEDTPTDEIRALKARNDDLERLVGKMALEIELLKKAAIYAQEARSDSSSITSGAPSPYPRGAK